MDTPPNNAAQLASPTWRLAAADPDFLMSDSMRGVRFLLEFAKCDEVLREHGILSTIVVFGSARARQDGPNSQGRWYEAARRFGTIASQRGGALREARDGRRNVIATGGGPGLMEAANRGAVEAGACTIGLGISLPREQEPNPYTTPSLTFQFHYFAMRKMHLAMRASALVVFPGGFGTFDELFEILTLRQTNKAPPIPIVLFDRDYWLSVINFEALAREGMIAPEDLAIFDFAETAEEVWDRLIEGGLKTL
jgi:uncharacterized protein (TIGR00730 family)